MFCDMVNSTALSGQFDPEDLRDIITAYRETCHVAIDRYEGFIANYSGDGIMVYFGYPRAHEDDAERAVRAGVEIVRAHTTQSEAPSRQLAVRIGIATGLVVVGNPTGDNTREAAFAAGQTPNLAARLQALAPINSVVVAQSTKSLLRSQFEYADLGDKELRGIPGLVRVWRVVGYLQPVSRFAATADAKLTPMVNREKEISLLLTRWQQAKRCEGQLVILSGEPGIGKSRVAQEFCNRIITDGHYRVSFQCSPYHTSTPLHPFIDQLKSVIGLDEKCSPVSSLRNLEGAISATTDRKELLVPLLASLLSIDIGASYEPLDLSPQKQKDDTVAALTQLFVELARNQPALMIFEDIHWIDPTSYEVLSSLTNRIWNSSVLLLVTSRPEFQALWNTRANVTNIALNRLGRRLRAAMVGRITGAKRLPNEIVEEIAVKTDGVPLFVEELTRAVLESEQLHEKGGRYTFSGPKRGLTIPATLTDSLMARLDRLGDFKQVAQIGAAVGRTFPYQLLLAVAEMQADLFALALEALEEAGLITRRGRIPDAIYTFKHALVQDAALSSLLRADRRRLHTKIAAALLNLYPERVEREPEVIGHHLTEAGRSEEAITFWLKAGIRAADTRANLEAIAHLRRGLEVLQANPGVPNGEEIELTLRIRLGVSLIRARGFAAQEVEANYMRAKELARKLSDERHAFTATRGLWVCHFIRADLSHASLLGNQLLELAGRTPSDGTPEQARQNAGLFIEAHRALGQTGLYEGRFVTSRKHFERGISLYDSDLHQHLVETHGIDPGIVCLSYLGYVLWFLGCPDQARRWSERALANAEGTRHPFSLAFALTFTAYLCQHLGDVQGARDHAQRAMVLSSEHGFLHWKYQSMMLRGWALAELGEAAEGLREIRLGLDEYEGMDSSLASSWFRCLLASAYVQAGRRDAARQALDDACVMAETTGERFYLAEIFRLQGEMTLVHDTPRRIAAVEDRFMRSLEVAREQHALSFELRTSVSLARLWVSLGRVHDAAELIGTIMSKYKEGHDTADVKTAVRIMAELRSC
jgi:class 3 adenylate cyclase/predicted ATPase